MAVQTNLPAITSSQLAKTCLRIFSKSDDSYQRTENTGEQMKRLFKKTEN